MVLKLFNTLTKQKEEFKPVLSGIVRMYNCGPTVYMTPHIGNYRAYLFADILKRYLKYNGYDVHQVVNITDVGHMTVDEDISGLGEDKMEKSARLLGKTPWEIAEFYTKIFMEEVEMLNIDKAMLYPRATAHIKEMIEITEALLQKGHAYIANGSVYYDIESFPDYGKLTGNTVEKLLEGAGGRVEHNPDKKNHFDFSLWVNDPSHIMSWSSPWCEKGYPGWHIECTAMSLKHLTRAFESGKFEPEKFQTLDIHTGGEDNAFPHHECEIAQTEGATGKKFSNFWMHTRHLLVYGKKMSKSKGNFYVLKDILDKGYSARAFRLAIISVNYRIPLNFTFESMDSAAKNLQKLDEFMLKIEELEESSISSNSSKKQRSKTSPEVIHDLIKLTSNRFKECMDDDLNISGGIAAIYGFVSEINKLIADDLIGKGDAKAVHEAMLAFDSVLGVLEKEKIKIPLEIIELAEQRLNARKQKNWELSDLLRKKIREHGYQVDDTETGYRLKKL